MKLNRKLASRTGQLIFWLCWPVHYIILRGSHRARVIVENEKGQILFVKNMISAGEWQLPGGGVEHNEDKYTGAARELKEETGLDLEPGQFDFLEQLEGSDYGLKFTTLLFRAKLNYTPQITPQFSEIVAYDWLDPLGSEKFSPHTKKLIAIWRQKASLLK